MGTRLQIKTTMETKSIAEELLGSIPLLRAFKMCSLVPYLSPEDATMVEAFAQSELATDYYVETVNIRCGRYENKNHLFDEFATFCGYDDSVYLRIDMINHIAENSARYEWDAHVLLTMHGSNLARWSARMTDPLNKGDELCIYSLCDMLKRHTFVYTKTKPWTTVDGSIADPTVAELCMLCDVRLIFLGDNNFGILKYKQRIESPITALAVQDTDDITNQNSTTVDRMIADTSSSAVVGILSDDLNTGTVVSIPNSPAAAEIEAAKCLLVLKREKSVAQTLPESTCDRITENALTQPERDDHTTAASPVKQLNDTEMLLSSINRNTTSLNKDSRHVETTTVETDTVETIAAVSTTIVTPPVNKTPGGVVILPLPSRPTTPLNTHPMNKTVVTVEEPSLSEVETSANNNKRGNPHVQEISWVKKTPSLTRCSVKLNKLSESDLKRMCNQIETCTENGKPDPGLLVESHYQTRSSVEHKQKRLSRLPRTASTNVSYEITSASSDDDKSPTTNKCMKLRPKREPSSTRIKANSFIPKPPPMMPQRRSPRNIGSKLNRESKSTNVSDLTIPKTSPSTTNETDEAVAFTNSASTGLKGDFKTRSYGLKRRKKPRKFGCKMCDKVCDSIHELNIHHQLNHNILYCDICTKAFNNPASLARHKYVHQDSKFQCADCDQSFPFESSLRSHRVSHRTLASYFCSHGNCTKKFKNKGDLTRHVKEHDGTMHECPDCDYKNADVRNLESHRIKHSNIEKYSCKLCEQKFKYNTQL